MAKRSNSYVNRVLAFMAALVMMVSLLAGLGVNVAAAGPEDIDIVDEIGAGEPEDNSVSPSGEGGDADEPPSAPAQEDAAEPAADPVAGDTQDIKIFFTSDLHGKFTSDNLATKSAINNGGLSRVATELLARQKTASESDIPYLTLDVGDTIEGGGVSCFIKDDTITNPMMEAFNYLKYDVFVPGNHEFNFGIPAGLNAINGVAPYDKKEGFAGSVLLGNVYQSTSSLTDLDYIDEEDRNAQDEKIAAAINAGTWNDSLLAGTKAYQIFERKGIKIAVIGMTGPGADTWDAVKLKDANVYTENAANAVERAIKDIDAKGGADIIIVAAHMGTGDNFGRKGSGASSVMAALNAETSAVRGRVDLFLGAHSHGVVNGTNVGGVRYGQNQSDGRSLGEFTIKATYGEDGKWKVNDKIADVTPNVAMLPGNRDNPTVEDADYLAHMEPWKNYVLAYMNTVFGELINGNMVNPNPLGTANLAYSEPTKLVEFIHDVQRYYGEAQISVACPFNNNVQHPEGDISKGTLTGIYNYDSNTVYRTSMLGWQVKRMMEAKINSEFRTPSTATDLSVRHSTSYNTDNFGGIKYTVDLTKPNGSRVTITQVNTGGYGSDVWTAFDMNAEYKVAANDYRTSSYILDYQRGPFTSDEIEGKSAPAGMPPHAMVIEQVDCNRGLTIAPDILSIMQHFIEEVLGGVVDATDYQKNWSITPWWNELYRTVAENFYGTGRLTGVTASNAAKVADVDSILKNLGLKELFDLVKKIDEQLKAHDAGEIEIGGEGLGNWDLLKLAFERALDALMDATEAKIGEEVSAATIATELNALLSASAEFEGKVMIRASASKGSPDAATQLDPAGETITFTLVTALPAEATLEYKLSAGTTGNWIPVVGSTATDIEIVPPMTVQVRGVLADYDESDPVVFEYVPEEPLGEVSAFPLNPSIVANQKIRLVYSGLEAIDAVVKYSVNGGEWLTYDDDVRIMMTEELLAAGGKIEAYAKTASGRVTAWKEFVYTKNTSTEDVVVNLFDYTDFHGQLDQNGRNAPGMARYAGVALKLMRDNPNSVFLAAGDNYQGSAVSNMLLGEPVSMLERRLGMEASAIGNHEYDWGADKINTFAENSQAKMLAANIWLKKGTAADNPYNSSGQVVAEDYTVRANYAEPYQILEIGGKKIGIIGWAGTSRSVIMAEMIEDVDFSNGGPWLGDMIKDLRTNKGCDAIIALTHARGGMTGEANLTDTNGNLQVIDGYFVGHSHGASASGSVVNAGTQGQNVGLLQLTFSAEDGSLKSVVASNTDSKNPSSTDYPADTLMSELYAHYNDMPELDVPLGLTGAAYDSRTDRDFVYNRAVYDSIERWTGENYVYMQNSGGMRSGANYRGVVADDIVTLRYLATLMPFDNEIVLANIEGQNLITAMNKQPNSVTGATRVDGTWYIDATGEAVVPGTYYKASFNNFMQGSGSSGGDGFDTLAPDNTPDYKFMQIPLRNGMVETMEHRTAFSIANGGTPVANWGEYQVIDGVKTWVKAEGIVNKYQRLSGELRAADNEVPFGGEATFTYSGEENGVSIVYSLNGASQETVSGKEASVRLNAEDFLDDTYFSGLHEDYVGEKRSDEKVAIVKAYAKADGYDDTYIGTFRFVQASVEVELTADPPAGKVAEGSVVTVTKGASTPTDLTLTYTLDEGDSATWTPLPANGKVTLPAELPATLRVKASATGYQDSEEVIFEYRTKKALVGDTFNLRMLTTNDMHGSFSDFRYSTDSKGNGLARLAVSIKELKKGNNFAGDANKTADATLLVDVGDTIQGNGTGVFHGPDWWNDTTNNPEQLYPVVKGMEYLGYDVWVLGNHEFNFGLEGLAKAYGKGKGENGTNSFSGAILAGNVFDMNGVDKDDESLMTPERRAFDSYHIEEYENGPRVAIIGMTQKDIVLWDRVIYSQSNHNTSQPASETAKVVEYLESEAGKLENGGAIDVYIMAQHMSRSEATRVLNAQVGTDKLVSDYAVYFAGGHDHSTEVNVVTSGENQLKFVESGGSGNARYLGQGDITITYTENGWKVVDRVNDVVAKNIQHNYSPSNPTANPADEEYMAAVQIAHDKNRGYMQEEIGILTGGPMVPEDNSDPQYLSGPNNVFYQDTSYIRFVHEGQIYYANSFLDANEDLLDDFVADRIAKGLFTADNLYSDETVISFFSPLDSGATIKPTTAVGATPGAILRAQMGVAYRYDNNTLTIMAMTGHQIKRVLEWGASKTTTVAADSGRFFPTVTSTSYDQPQGYGMSYNVDITKPIYSRIVDLTMNGEPMDMDKTYLVTLNNHTAGSRILGDGNYVQWDNPEDPNCVAPRPTDLNIFDFDVSQKLIVDGVAKGNGEGVTGLLADYIERAREGKLTTPFNGKLSTETSKFVKNWDWIAPENDKYLREKARLVVNSGAVNYTAITIANLKDYLAASVEPLYDQYVAILALNQEDYPGKDSGWDALMGKMDIAGQFIVDSTATTTSAEVTPVLTALQDALSDMNLVPVTGTISVSKGSTVEATELPAAGEDITLTLADAVPAEATLEYTLGVGTTAVWIPYTEAVKVIPPATLRVRAAAENYMPSIAVSFEYVSEVLEEVTIDIFSFNDFHGTVDKSASSSNPGADRFVALVKELQKENANNLILAAGDNYQGSAISNLFEGEPVSAMMKELGVKYSAVGNHEYDWGPDKFAKYEEDGNITFLAANIFIKGSTTDRPDYVTPYVVEEIAGKKIGIIGLTTSDIPTLVKSEFVENLDIVDPSTAEAGVWLDAMIEDLKTQGCDAVIALTHLGASQSGDVISGDVAKLANSTHGAKFDAVITGHTHKVVSGYVNGVAVVQGNYNGRGLGRLTLDFTGDELVVTPNAYNQNDMNSANILPVGVVDERMREIIAGFNEILGPMLAKVVGVYGQDINSRNEQAEWANQLVYEYIKRVTGTDYVLVQNAGGWRDTSPYDRKATDNVTMGYMYTLMPFDNEIVLMDLGGEYLLDILNNQSQFTSLPVLTGVTKTGDNWYLPDGTLVEKSGTYKVSCNDFMLTGGDKYFQFGNGTAVSYMGVPLRDAMVESLLYRLPSKEFSVSPSHAILTTVGHTAEFEIVFNDGAFDAAARWSAEPAGVVSFVDGNVGSKVKVRLDNDSQAATVALTAEYLGCTFTSTVEVMPGGLDAEDAIVKVLDSKVTVNKAKEIGALVPILISTERASKAAESVIGSSVIDDVKLEVQAKDKSWNEVAGLDAKMYDKDARYIRIDAQDTAKTAKNVKVSVLPAGKDGKDDANWKEAGTIKTLTVTTKYPSIKLSVSGSLNRQLPLNTVEITATSVDGAAKIESVTGTGITATNTDIGTSIVTLAGATKNVKATVAVSVAGYKANPYKKTPTVTVKVINTKPSVKLSQSSVTIVDNGLPVQIGLVSSKKTVAFEENYTVKSVTLGTGRKALDDTQVEVAYAGGIITVTPKAGTIKSGTAVLTVAFEGTESTVDLKLKITVKAPGKIKPSAKPTKVTVNKTTPATASGTDIISVPISLGVANLTSDKWEITSYGKNDDGVAFNNAIEMVPGNNMFTLRVKNPEAFANLSKKHELNIGASDVNSGKTFKFTVNVSSKLARISKISLKGSIDIVNPDSIINATVTLAEVTSPIADVKLLSGSNESRDFTVLNVAGNTFQIKAAHRALAPEKQTLTAKITLENGQPLEKTISITPKMGKLKASQSTKAITLYKATPKTGQAVSIDLTKPAGVKLGAVVINQASVNKMKLATGGFELVQSGSNEWTIYFKDGKVPTPQKGNLKSSYTLKLDVWAEGTYTVDKVSGEIKPLPKGKTTTKPTTVSVKINLA